MKKILMSILFLLFATSASLADTNKSLSDIERLGKAVDNCLLAQKQNLAVAEQKEDNRKIQKLNNELVKCYQKVANEAFELFYAEKETEMKKAFSKFISAAYEWNASMYNYSNACYSENEHLFCGSVADRLSSTEVENLVRDAVLRMLIYTKKILTAN